MSQRQACKDYLDPTHTHSSLSLSLSRTHRRLFNCVFMQWGREGGRDRQKESKRADGIILWLLFMAVWGSKECECHWELCVFVYTPSLCGTHTCVYLYWVRGCVYVCEREREKERGIVHVCESVNEKMVLRAKLIPFEDYSNNFRFQIMHTFATLHEKDFISTSLLLKRHWQRKY